ncbi:unnamed protein product [Owenia fusiformis]|uniref:Uncharacterized protein n=1 Tax=Owenia fusiformis TaxID=6347 RepID=A0A8J1UIQ0_OWEFU|nr:unnamed protein product [Owenia fusiformis]
MAEVKNDEGATPLMIACQGGNVDQVNTLLEEKTSLLDIDSTGKTCLHYCVENKDTTVAEILLEADTDHKLLQIQDEEGYNAAHMCVIAGNSDLLKVLLKEGTEIECTDKEQHTAVHWATVCGQEEIIDILCEYDAELSKPDIHHAYPLHYAAQMCGEEEGNDPVTGLAILKKLLSKDITINVEDSDQRQPLLWAASAGSGDACAALVDSGADVNAADKDGLNALHCAASRGHTACVEALVKTCKAAIDCDDKNGCTSLFYAITMDHLETAKLLLELGASPNHRDKKGRSPAHCAASKGNQSGISLISEKGGDIWLKNSKGELPLHEASQAGHKALVTQIMSDEKQREKMLDNLNSSNSDGRTCLHLAAMTNNLELCKLFLDNGANVNALMFYKNKYLTPYDTAVVKGHKECAEYLKSHGATAGVKVANHNASKIQRQFRKNQKKEEPPEEPPKTPEDEKSVIESEKQNEEENVNVILENEKDSEDEKEEEEEAEKEEEVEEDNVEDNEEDKDIDETTPRQKKKRTKSGNQDSPLARSVRNSVKIYEQTRSTIQSLQRLKRMQIYLGGQLTETMLVRKFRESEKQLRKLATEEHDITSSNQWEQYLLDQISFLTKVSHSDHPEFRSVKAMAKEDTIVEEEREEEERKRAEQEFEDHQQRNDHMYNDLNTRTNMRLSQAKATNSQIEETLQKSRLERRKKNQGDMAYGKQQKRLAKAYCPGEPTEVLDDIFKNEHNHRRSKTDPSSKINSSSSTHLPKIEDSDRPHTSRRNKTYSDGRPMTASSSSSEGNVSAAQMRQHTGVKVRPQSRQPLLDQRQKTDLQFLDPKAYREKKKEERKLLKSSSPRSG